MKLHDWILETINNLGFSPTNFKSIGLSTANTQLLPMEDYLKSSYILDNPLFKNDNGEFSKDKFTQFYNLKAGEFLKFSEDYDTFLYDLFDTRRRVDSEIKNPNMTLRQVSNPLHLTTGIAGRNEVRNGEFTNKELAQRNKIYDTKTGEFLDYSVNDYALSKNPLKWLSQLIEDPIVYATWDEDGQHIDPITYNLVDHKKGEFKVNKDGEYYTERLGDNSARGKQVVSIFDNITVDGTGINKYDFFDADGFDKSAAGSIFSAAATIAPLLGGPWVAGIYSGLLIARELSKALPMLGGMIDSLAGTNLEDSSLFNFLSAKGTQLTGGTSQYAQEHMFSIENFSKLASDVVLLYGLQQLIAKSLRQLMGGKKLINLAYQDAAEEYRKMSIDYVKNKLVLEGPDFKNYTGVSNLNELMGAITSGAWTKSAFGKAALLKYLPKAEEINKKINRIGADAALAYMAIVSNTDVYESLLEHGTTKGEAALFAFGSTLGMFAVDKYAHLGELFFDELADNSGKFMRLNMKSEAANARRIFGFAEDSNNKNLNKLQSIILAGKDFGLKHVTNYIDNLKYHTTGFVGKALGEGLEEFSEELVTDFTKTLYELLGNYGIVSTNDVGAWDEALARYTMSFLGGAMGGGMFYGIGMYNGQYPLQVNDLDMLYHIRNGKTKDYLNLVDEWEKQGKFGSTELSATNKTTVTDNDGNTKEVFLTATDQNDTLNHWIALKIKEGIISLDNVINGNQLNLNDNLLFDLMVASEKRYLDLKDWLLDLSYLTGYYQVYLNLVNDIVKADLDLERASKTKDGTPDDPNLVDDEWRRNNRDSVEGRKRAENLLKLIDKKENLLKQLEEFKSGDTSLYYTRKMLFGLDRGLSSLFFPNTFEEYVLKHHRVSVESLNLIDKQKYYLEYKDYQENQKKNVLSETFDKFLDVELKVSPSLYTLEENSKEFLKYSDKINKLFSEGSSLLKMMDYSDKLEEETEEDVKRWVDLNLRVADKGAYTEEEAIFYNERKARVDAKNDETRLNFYNEILEVLNEALGKIDPIAYRKLIYNLDKRRKDVADKIVNDNTKDLLIDGITVGTLSEIKKLLSKITPENKKETLQTIEELIKTPIEKAYKDLKSYYRNLSDFLGDLLELNMVSEEDQNNLTVAGAYQFLDKITISEGDVKSEELKKLLQLYLDSKPEDDLVWDFLINDEESVVEPDIKELMIPVLTAADLIIELNKNSKDLQVFDTLKAKVLRLNPFINFVTEIGSSLGIEGIEESLQFVFNLMEDIDSKDNFLLSKERTEELLKVGGVLDLVKAYLRAASRLSSALNPYGHNKAVNDYIKNHKSELTKIPEQPLPELSDEAYLLFSREAGSYKSEINYLIELSRQNSVNKAKRFLGTEKQFNKARLLSLTNLRPHFKFNLKGKEVDLFTGFESVNTDDKSIGLKTLEELLYNNFLNLINEGNTVEEILEGSKIIEKLLDSNDVSQLLSTILDEDLTYDTFTKYDRFIHLLSTLSLNTRDWNKFLKDKISQDSNKVPLTILLYVAKIAVSSLDKSSIFNKVLDYIENKKLLDSSKLQALKNTVFISGIGGAGKSAVVARYVIDYATDVLKMDLNKVWLSAPKKSQRDNLKTSTIKGVVKTKEELMGTILDPTVYNNLMADINSNNNKSKYYKTVKLPDGNYTILLNWDEIKLNNSSISPELLVIDEVTHFSLAELQILDKWINGKIISLGDPILAGFNKVGRNINRENIFTIRTPKLRISLRDNNLLNLENQVGFSEILDFLAEKDANDPEYDNYAKLFIERIDNFKVRAYNGSEVNGTLYLKDLTEDVLSKLKGDIAFVGDSGSSMLTKLKEKGLIKEDKDHIFKTAADIQGLEFDYVIVDYDFKSPYMSSIGSSRLRDKASGYYGWGLEFYTLISRAKTASIFIENGSLVGENVIDKFKATAPSIMDAIDQFKGPQINDINAYLATEPPVALNKVEEAKEESKKEDILSNPEDDEEVPTPVEDVEENSDEDFINILNVQIDKVTYPVYTNFNILGARREIDESTGEKLLVWHPALEGQEKRDAEIFIKEIIHPSNPLYFNQRTFIEDNLRKLINGIVYNDHTYEDLTAKIPEFTTIISRDTFEKLKKNIYVEIREVDPNRDLIMNPVFGSNGDPTLKTLGNNRIITLITKADGVKVTLGVFADPETLNNPETIKKTKELFRKTIDKVDIVINLEKATGERLKAYLDYLDLLQVGYNNVESDAKAYANAVAELTKNDLTFRVDVDFNGLTRLHRINPISLNTYRKNRSVVISKPFIYVGDLPGINNKAVKGRAVVLTSGDTLLGPEELIELYELQKEYARKNNTLDPTKQLEHLPRVRMEVLYSKGLDLIDVLTRQVHAPIAWGLLGIRLLTSTWNFRANLLLFLEEYEKSFKDYNLDAILLTLVNIDEEYNGRPMPYTIDNYKEIKDKILKFNKSLATKVKLFRLGGREEIDSTGKKVGSLYIRKITDIPSDSVLYKDPSNVHGVYITPSRAYEYRDMLNAYFNMMSKIVIPKTSDGKILDAKTLLSTKESASNNINSYISLVMEQNYKITLPNGQQVVLDSDKGVYPSWAIALLKLLRLAHAVSVSLESPEEYFNDKGYRLEVGEEELHLDTSEVLKHVKLGTDKADLTLENMFRIIVHGTTESIYGELQDDGTIKYPQKATDAYFKKGIFPHSARGNYITDNFAECTTDEMFYDIDAIAISPTFLLSLSQMKDTGKPDIEETILLSQEDILELLSLASSFRLEEVDYDVTKSLEENKLKLNKVINTQLNKNLTSIMRSTSVDDLNTIITRTDDYLPITLKLYIETKTEYTIDDVPIITNSVDGKEVYILSKSNGILIIYNPYGKKIDTKLTLKVELFGGVELTSTEYLKVKDDTLITIEELLEKNILLDSDLTILGGIDINSIDVKSASFLDDLSISIKGVKDTLTDFIESNNYDMNEEVSILDAIDKLDEINDRLSGICKT